MRQVAVSVALLILVASFVAAGDSDLKALEKKLAGYVDEVAATLRTIKDKASAQEALPKFDQLQQKGKALEKEFTALPAAKQDTLTQKNSALDKASKALIAEVQRLEKSPDAKAIMEVLRKAVLFKEGLACLCGGEEAKVAGAKAQIKMLELASQAYHLKNGTPPPSLEALINKENGGPYLADKQALLDPWGKQYQYNAASLKNMGKAPDIWTVTPQLQIIGNWMLGAKKP